MIQILMGLATMAAMTVATLITVVHARRPTEMVAQYGQQPVSTDGLAPVAGYGPPVTMVPKEEKPLWLTWLQMFLVAELAATLVVSLFTGGFGAFNALTTKSAG